MSQESVEIIRSGYEAISRGDWDRALESAVPEFEFLPPDRSPVSTPLRGVEEFRAWVADQEQTVGELSNEVEELIEAGEFVVALIRLRVPPHGSDADLELRIAHLWTVRDGKLIRCEVFPSERRPSMPPGSGSRRSRRRAPGSPDRGR